ncbi:nucleotide sugar dehydrogenase [Deinococcus sp. UR1]|uniref:nucleotide sugar dehydrogenase n=1 Tax=Deinococcus sp. UR1 TaxID=1704277 RepID=UPI0006DC2A5D|nr:nucleotide sugar dehydrogenase [Deinococcus sp. UR1]PIG94888.1 nucleotide sugar dehydrogenase [Deinococcus sp. UR1]
MEKIAVVGLGYVGLPLLHALSHHFNVMGFDINNTRIEEIRNGFDSTGELNTIEIEGLKHSVTSRLEEISDATAYIITVPTPIDQFNSPDLTPLKSASEAVGSVLRKGDLVIYESTVYPGVTEEFCGPILSKVSGLLQGQDFNVGYSPERINPGDKKMKLHNILKVVSADSEISLKRVINIYSKIITAGIYSASSIKVAEAAKVIENTQRDVNIALVNELAMIFSAMGISTLEVLEAAGTKWNFLNFRPGLVGGHCIGVDPYYLTQKAEVLGYYPEIILSSRRVNEKVPKFIVNELVKLMIASGKPLLNSRIGILGLTFKENVPDIRNSKSFEIVKELGELGFHVLAHDPFSYLITGHAKSEMEIVDIEAFCNLDALIVAVAHDQYRDLDVSKMLTDNGILMDIKGIMTDRKKDLVYWSL